MLFTAASHLDKRKSADLLVVPFWKGKKHAEAAAPVGGLAAALSAPVDCGDFSGKEGELLILYESRGKRPEKRLALLGLGEEREFSPDLLRRSYAEVVKVCHRKKLSRLNILLPKVDKIEKESICQLICEGLLLTDYTFDTLKGEFKQEEVSKVEKVSFIGADSACLHLCKRAALVMDAVNHTRDLVNGNADDVTPQAFVACAEELEKKHQTVKTIVLGKKELEKQGLGLLLAVSRGAARDPALITIEYRGDPKSSKSTALVGKGITFDTGGLNIKQTGQMETMKDDMAGAAAVLGTVSAAAEMGLKVNLIGVIATTENAIGPHSYKPGDVYRSYSGKTVEISNTDAEGRLVLADALSYLQAKFQPTRIIDLATLTGGIVVALGEELTGLFSNDETLARELIHAGERTHERLWRMPLLSEYREQLKSPIADLKNSGGKKASSSTAAAFLKEFIKEGTPWAHLDIAGTAYLSAPKHYHQTLATGVGVRLLISLLE
jgi:leucyl aminopeptidase